MGLNRPELLALTIALAPILTPHGHLVVAPMYLAKDGDALIVLYGGGTKKSQSKDIERALAMHAEYKARKAAAAKPRAEHTRKTR